MPTLLFRQTFPAESLLREHPPRFRHPHKQRVFDLACPAGTRHAGTIELTRWRAEGLPKSFPWRPPR